MTGKKMLLLGVLLIGVLAYIFMYEIPKTKQKEVADNVFDTMVENQLKTVTIRKNDTPVSLVNKSWSPEKPESKDSEKAEKKGQWELANLPGVPLDGSSVQALMTPLLSLKSENAIPAEEKEADLGVYGLQTPELIIEAVRGDGSREIRFGKKNEYVFKRYFQVSGRDSVYLTSETLFTAADKSQKDFRKKDLVSFGDYEASGLELRKGEEKLVFEKAGEDQWKILEPLKATASEEKMRGVFRELRDLKADEFLDFSPADSAAVLSAHHLDAPQFYAQIKKSADPLTVIAGEESKASDASNKQTVFRVDNLPFVAVTNSPVLGRISMNPEDYRERKLFSWGTEAVKKAVIERAGQEPATLVLDNDLWKLDGKDADQMFVQQFFKDLSDVTAASFAEPQQPQAYGFDKPQLKITISSARYGSDEKPVDRTLVIGSDAPNGVYAATGDLSEPFVIEKDYLAKIEPSKEKLLPAPPVTPTAEAKGENG